jgi:hypothetical protein
MKSAMASELKSPFVTVSLHKPVHPMDRDEGNFMLFIGYINSDDQDHDMVFLKDKRGNMIEYQDIGIFLALPEDTIPFEDTITVDDSAREIPLQFSLGTQLHIKIGSIDHFIDYDLKTNPNKKFMKMNETTEFVVQV